MEAINISLSRNYSEQVWSVEIAGKLHDDISTKTLDGLVDYVLDVAEQNLLKSETSSDCSETASVSAPSD